MYCPNCGSENDKNQNFCRYCGFNLEETAKSLKLQRAFGERAYKLKKNDQIKRAVNRVSEVLAICFFFGLVIVFLTDTVTVGAFLRFSFAVYLIFFAIRKLVDLLVRGETKKEAAGAAYSGGFEEREIKSVKTSKLIRETPFVPAGIETEYATELLYVENETRKF